jgi:hypothetical protein
MKLEEESKVSVIELLNRIDWGDYKAWGLAIYAGDTYCGKFPKG